MMMIVLVQSCRKDRVQCVLHYVCWQLRVSVKVLQIHAQGVYIACVTSAADSGAARRWDGSDREGGRREGDKTITTSLLWL